VTAGKSALAKAKALDGDLASLFGIDIDIELDAAPAKARSVPGKKLKATSSPEPAIPAQGASPTLPVKAARQAKPAASAPPRTLSGRDLLLLGVPSSTVQYWLRTGVLGRTETQGVYGWTPVAEARLARFQAR
jgi:hypothetical protein